MSVLVYMVCKACPPAYYCCPLKPSQTLKLTSETFSFPAGRQIFQILLTLGVVLKHQWESLSVASLHLKEEEVHDFKAFDQAKLPLSPEFICIIVKCTYFIDGGIM